MIPHSMRLIQIAASAAVSFSLMIPLVAQAQLNFYGNYTISKVTRDPNIPQDQWNSRANFTTETQPIAGGMRVVADLWHGQKNEPVSMFLEVVINDGKGGFEAIPFMKLDNEVKDNPTNYHSRRTYDLTYADLNQKLKSVLPPNLQHLEIGPGSPILLKGRWTAYNHTWGGIDRGGIMYMPEDAKVKSQQVQGAMRRAQDLDIGFEIMTTMALQWNNIDAKGVSHGLKRGGQIKSRLEEEGKYQIPLKDADAIKQRLFQIAKDPAEVSRIFGADWTLEAEMRYMKKDKATGQLILDANGLPTPDPMVDTAQDNANMDAAKRDMVIRYRFTEQNGAGSWNYKPGITWTAGDGIVKRIESAVETTDDKPETIRKFADSRDPLNPFRSIYDIVPGSKPSDFFQNPSLKIVDTRFKFKLQHKSGLVVEISLDDAMAESLRASNRKVRFVQMEMDIDHPSTQTANVAKVAISASRQAGIASGTNIFGNNLATTVTPELKTFLDGLTKEAFIDGRPVLHTPQDVDPSSPVNQKNAADFATAETAIRALRDAVIGPNWIAAPTKVALSAVLLDLVDRPSASPSVKAFLARVRRLRSEGKDPGLMFEDHSKGRMCRALFGGGK